MSVSRVCPLIFKTISYTKNSSFTSSSFWGIRSLHKSPRVLAEKRFSEKHEWVSREGSLATVGISDYAQETLGDVVYVQLPDVGAEFNAHDEVGAVESVKAASEIYTPVSGKVVQVNDALEEKPGLVNTSCYDQGWLFKINIKNQSEYDKLMSQEDYDKYLKSVKH